MSKNTPDYRPSVFAQQVASCILSSPIMRTPMILVLLAVATGTAAESHVAAPAAALCGGAAAFLLAALAVRRAAPRQVLLLLSLAALAILRAGAVSHTPEGLALRAPHITEVVGTVVSYPSLGRDRIRFVVQPDHLPSRFLVTWERPDAAAGAIHCGDRVLLAGRAQQEGTFAGFDYRRLPRAAGHLRHDARRVVGPRASRREAGDPARRRPRAAGAPRFAPAAAHCWTSSPWRRAMSSATATPSPTRPRKRLPRPGSCTSLRSRACTSPILLAGAWWILRRLGARAAVAYPVLALFVLVAVWIVGPWVSFVRSALLFFFVAAGSVLADLGLTLRRSVRPMNALATAAVVVLLIDPQALYDIGFQLSVAATAGLLAFAPPRGWPALRMWPRPIVFAARAAASLFLVSLAAQAGAAPILAVHFGKVQVWTAITGMVAIPLSSVALWLGVVALAVSPAGPLADAAARLFGWTLQAFEAVVAAAAHLPWTTLPADGRVGVWLGSLAVFLYCRAPGARQPASSHRRGPCTCASGPRTPRDVPWRRARRCRTMDDGG